jgi:mRNA interferase MazF
MAARKPWCPDRRDMIWIDFDPRSGREMKAVHPMLVLSPRNFNERTGIVIGLPMTTAAFNASNPFAVPIEGGRGKTSYILTHQPKSFDWRARRARPHPLRTVPAAVFELACESLNQIIDVGA